MGSKPKQQDYQASAGEKASAAVAMAEHKFFKENYDPLLKIHIKFMNSVTVMKSRTQMRCPT